MGFKKNSPDLTQIKLGLVKQTLFERIRRKNKDAGGCIYISKIGINDRGLNGKYIPINRCYIQAYVRLLIN